MDTGGEYAIKPSLESLLEILQDARRKPEKTLEKIKQLFDTAEKLVRIQDMGSESNFDQIFTKLTDQKEITDNIQEFMDNGYILAENQSD